jgi:hypothetical protein
MQVKFNKLTQATGRNGCLKCSGLDLLKLDSNGTILLAPLTSKGFVARCDIEIPVEVIPELIANLQEMIATRQIKHAS